VGNELENMLRSLEERYPVPPLKASDDLLSKDGISADSDLLGSSSIFLPSATADMNQISKTC
jgi:hypothetical protein